ncbi:hypothetical protein [Candidatus Amarolinea aalborgensis]|jgi:hypothetical protein|uniref:hypothetical protein n=1 Tax=Candidatus Amarolinea aalborgensis TaxID=2249329 RepID=UPI003BFA2E84
MPDVYSKEVRPNNDPLRDLLNAVLSDDALTVLCSNHFRPVYEKFNARMARTTKVQRLLDYVRQQDQVQSLLARLEEINPVEVARYRAQQTGRAGA